jgi:hypothetical protein
MIFFFHTSDESCDTETGIFFVYHGCLLLFSKKYCQIFKINYQTCATCRTSLDLGRFFDNNWKIIQQVRIFVLRSFLFNFNPENDMFLHHDENRVKISFRKKNSKQV